MALTPDYSSRHDLSYLLSDSVHPKNAVADGRSNAEKVAQLLFSVRDKIDWTADDVPYSYSAIYMGMVITVYNNGLRTRLSVDTEINVNRTGFIITHTGTVVLDLYRWVKNHITHSEKDDKEKIWGEVYGRLSGV